MASAGAFGLAGDDCGPRRLLVEWLQSDACDLGVCEVHRETFKAVAEREGWRAEDPAWCAGDELLELPVRKCDGAPALFNAPWGSAENDYVDADELAKMMQQIHAGGPGLTIVWPEAVKQEMAQEMAAHEVRLEERLARPRPLKEMIVDLTGDDEESLPLAPLELLDSWRPAEKRNWIYLYFNTEAGASVAGVSNASANARQPTPLELALTSLLALSPQIQMHPSHPRPERSHRQAPPQPPRPPRSRPPRTWPPLLMTTRSTLA